GPPAVVRDGNRSSVVRRGGGLHPLAQEREGALFALGARQAATQVADIVEVAPELAVRRETAHKITVETHPGPPSAAPGRRIRSKPSFKDGQYALSVQCLVEQVEERGGQHRGFPIAPVKGTDLVVDRGLEG